MAEKQKFHLVYYDGQDERERIREIEVPLGKDPKEFAYQFLSNWGELGKYGFEIRLLEPA
jgi:hypothetical protein